METILIIIHLMIVVALVVVVLLQRSEGGALGIGGGGGGLMSARGAANALTRTTGILAAAFFVTSLSLGILARYGAQPTDILDRLPVNQSGQSAPAGDGNDRAAASSTSWAACPSSRRLRRRCRAGDGRRCAERRASAARERAERRGRSSSADARSDG